MGPSSPGGTDPAPSPGAGAFVSGEDRSPLESLPLWDRLPAAERDHLRALGTRYRLTFQEGRALVELACDLHLWREPPLRERWARLEEGAGTGAPDRARKKRLLSALDAEITTLRREPTDYSRSPEPGSSPPAAREVAREAMVDPAAPAGIGDCPVASERTVCCRLRTIDAVESCAYDCSYCTIQTFYGAGARIDGRLHERLDALDLDPDRFYHFGSGQSSDSLLWGNRGGILDAQLAFAAKWPRILVELKTKSARVEPLLDREVPPNVVCSWSLNTEEVARHEERLAPSVARRLDAARRAADSGIRVAFHLHPIVHHVGWEAAYSCLACRVLERFRPEEVLFVSLGSVTFIRPVLRQIRERGEPTRIHQMELAPDPHGKLSYPHDLKVRLFRSVHEALRPWHGRVFMYLCMEAAQVWRDVFGRVYDTNLEFERDFGEQVMPKVRGRKVRD